MDENELIARARAAMEAAYAPYSGFRVGAALLCSDGTVYTGCNIENASFGATCCAERTAIFKAVSEGRRDFEGIAVASSGSEPAYPCGICRQVMAEFGIKWAAVEGGGRYRLEELLPHSFTKFG